MLRLSLLAFSVALAFWLGYFAQKQSRIPVPLPPVPPVAESVSPPVPELVAPVASSPAPPPKLASDPVIPQPVPSTPVTSLQPKETAEALLRHAIVEPPGIQRVAYWQEALDAVTERNWREFFTQAWQARQRLEITADEEQWMLQRLGIVAGEAAMNRFKPKDPVKDAETHVGRYAMQGWAAKDPTAAWAYIEAQPKGRFRDGMMWGYALAQGTRNIANALQALDQLEPFHQENFMRRLLEGDQPIYFSRLIDGWLESGPKIATEGPRQKKDAREFVFREYITARTRQVWGDPTGERFITWMEQFRGAPFVTQENLGAAARHLVNHRNHAETMNWLERYSEDHDLLQKAVTEVMNRWAAADSSDALQWITSRKNTPIYDLAVVSFALAPNGLPSDQISSLLETVQDPDSIKQVLRKR